MAPELVKWLREASKAVRDTEETTSFEEGPTEDFPLETTGFEDFEFQLANGNNVKVVFARFWERLTLEDRREGARPSQYYAIKVYSTEGELPRRMAAQCEFRATKDFAFVAVPKTWEWLGELVDDRQAAKYDWLDEFIEELAEKIADFSDAGEDAVEHIERLPELANPGEFDKVDDSIFNDQNDS